MASTLPPRRLAAVWFADIVGYTTLSAKDEAAALALVRDLQEVAEDEVASQGGRVVKFLGDAVLAEFPGVEAAVGAGLGLAERFRERTSSAGEGAALRIGVHLGEVACAEDGDIYGDVVNVASRLQAAAAPGQALVSDDVRRQLQRRPAFVFEPAGVRTLKGLPEPLPTWVATQRYPDPGDAGGGGAVQASPDPSGRKRLVVIPFHLLRPDPEIEFLTFGIPDAIAVTLMDRKSLVVRSTASVMKHTSHPPDPVRIAREAQVDFVLSGTVLRAGEQVRVTAQLAEGGTGTLVWSESTTVTMGDLFELQDGLANGIVASVAAPLAPGEAPDVRSDVPASGEAYELYLRANQVSLKFGDWSKGVQLYELALGRDPDFAPAWARLGRCYRLIGKYAGDPALAEENLEKAEDAFIRALELNPDLELAHNLFAQHEVEAGRPVEAMLRLLRQAGERGSDVDLLVGLTHACRYCGLQEASLAAHARATELDPQALTSVAYTHFQIGEYERALDARAPEDPIGAYALLALDRPDEASQCARAIMDEAKHDGLRSFARTVLAVTAGEREDALEHGRRALHGFPDPEGQYFMAGLWSTVGVTTEALELLEDVVARGFACAAGLRTDPFFEAIRDEPAFGALLERAEAAASAADVAFRGSGGPILLGLAEGPE